MKFISVSILALAVTASNAFAAPPSEVELFTAGHDYWGLQEQVFIRNNGQYGISATVEITRIQRDLWMSEESKDFKKLDLDPGDTIFLGYTVEDGIEFQYRVASARYIEDRPPARRESPGTRGEIRIRHASAYPWSILFEMNGQRYELNPGQTVVIPANGWANVAVWECVGARDNCGWDRYTCSSGMNYRIVDYPGGQQWDLVVAVDN
ncbi:MAG: hypothetical protein NTW97_05875 [Candidatus Krumholzibacteria bacterium]|nr:hypothetical protein [Candidatus Krumholzibacteria bacterium]